MCVRMYVISISLSRK